MTERSSGPDDVVMETERTWLRGWRRSDAERVLDIYSRWEVAKWLGADPKVMESREQAERSVLRWEEINAAEGCCGVWAVERKADRVVAGTVLLVQLPDTDGEIEVGWHFHPDSWGQGLASESAGSALGWGFASGLNKILAVVRPGNFASMAVCRRIGMTGAGLTSAYYGTELELFRISAPQDPTSASS